MADSKEEAAAASAADDAAASGGEDATAVIEIDEATAAAIAEVRSMLRWRVNDEVVRAEVPSLESQLAATGAPLRVEQDTSKGRKVVATRDIAEGEVVLTEQAAAVALCRSPGCDAVFSMRDTRTGRLVCTLPAWAAVRTFRDTFTLAPRFVGSAEACYSTLSQLTAYGQRDHDAWAGVPEVPPGIDEDEPANEVPRRAQLLHAIAQGNGFVVPLPEEDSEWKRALLWPMLGRIQLPEDRDRLFDDPSPLTHLTGFFPMAALINHACQPNVTYAGSRWDEGEEFPTFSFRATRPIRAGEECCYPYVSGADETEGIDDDVDGAAGDDDEEEVEEAGASAAAAAGAGGAAPSSQVARNAAKRRYKLLLTYRFRCMCDRCLAEIPGLREGATGGGSGGGGSGGSGGGGADPLAKHFPFGEGVDGVLKFYSLGGTYPAQAVGEQHHREEQEAEEQEAEGKE
jgi:hypothetical protein